MGSPLLVWRRLIFLGFPSISSGRRHAWTESTRHTMQESEKSFMAAVAKREAEWMESWKRQSWQQELLIYSKYSPTEISSVRVVSTLSPIPILLSHLLPHCLPISLIPRAGRPISNTSKNTSRTHLPKGIYPNPHVEEPRV